MSSNPEQSYDDHLHNALKWTMSNPHGRLALAWAMNIVPAQFPTEENGMQDSSYLANQPTSERDEGFRQAGQEALRVLRMEFPSRYAILMQEVVSLQVSQDSILRALADEKEALDDRDSEGVED